MKNKFNRLLNLSSKELGWLLSAYWFLGVWDIRISLLPYRFWRRHLMLDEQNNHIECDIKAIKHINLVFDIAVRHNYKSMNCLRRCLALKAVLNRNTQPSELHIGVRMDSNKNVQAHSWLTSKDTLINDNQNNIDTYQEITNPEHIFRQIK